MRTLNSFATLSIAALLAASSAALAQVAPAPTHHTPTHVPAVVEAPVATVPAAPEAAPAVAIPEPAPAPVSAVPEPAPVVVAVPEPAPAPKPAEPAISIGGTKISLYGFFQLNGVYEDGANGGNNWSIFVPKNAQDGEGRLLLNANSTRIGVNVAGQPKESGAEVSGKFEIDFLNSNARYPNGLSSANVKDPNDKTVSVVSSSLRIRHAYGQFKFNDIGLSLLFGQTQDIIAPLSAPTLNQGALQGQGSLGTRRPMIRLAETVGPIEIAAAATDNRDASSPVLPAFQGSVKAKVPAVWAGEKQNVEFILSGHYASKEVAAEDSAGVAAKDADSYKEPPASWSGVASLSLPVVSIVNLSGEVFYGQNLSSYSNGSLGQNLLSKSGDGLQSIGGWGAANIKLPAGFALAGGYGVEAIDKDREPKTAVDKDGKLTLGRIKNAVIFANLKYFVDEAAFIGFEYANLATDYVDNTGDRKTGDGKLNRFELVFNYAFK
ncbi:hypothetical protein R83H12_00795 [Fibrobacteria bacterium R8-3-H12]